MAEIAPHHRRLGHLFQQRPVVAEGIARQDVPVFGDAEMVTAQRIGAIRHHQHLGQREGHALTQLVRSERRGVEPAIHALALPERRWRRQCREHVEIGARGCGRRRDLLVDPALVTAAAELRDAGATGPERGLGQEARGLVVARRHEITRLETGRVAAEDDIVSGPHQAGTPQGQQTSPNAHTHVTAPRSTSRAPW